MSRFAEIFALDQGVSLKLTAVLPAELIVKFEGPTADRAARGEGGSAPAGEPTGRAARGEEVAPRVGGAAGTGLVVGLLSLAPGCSWPLYRFLAADQVFFVHKGQGRVTIGGRPTTVVPGIMVAVPRESWVSWRNTGTSPLQLMWSAEPAATLQCLRELAGLQTADPAALEGLAQRYGFEVQLQAASDAPAPRESRPDGPSRGRRHRRGRGGARGARPAAAQGTVSPTPTASSSEPTISAPASIPTAAPEARQASITQSAAGAPAAAGTAGGPRHRRRGRGRGRGGRSGQGDRRPPQASAPSTQSSSPAAPARETPAAAQSSGKPSGRVKEVYMRGRWIPVSGDGPMVDLGRRRRPEQFKRGRPPSSAGGEHLSEEL